jgi:microcompartment protein CcmK/EutM
MQLGRVVGSVVASTRSAGLEGRSLRLVRPTSEQDTLSGDVFVAVDTVGSGEGEMVLITTGSSARAAVGDVEVDAAIVAIVDEIDSEGKPKYRK